MPALWVALIAAGSIAALLLAGTGIAVLSSSLSGLSIGSGLASLARQGCLPQDFPHYPGASISSVSSQIGPGAVCTVSQVSADPPDQVSIFYDETLSAWPWRKTGGGSALFHIDFGRQDSSTASGKITIGRNGTGSLIWVTYSP